MSRRTNPGFLSNGEDEQDNMRLQGMVRGILGAGKSEKIERMSRFVASSRFWSKQQMLKEIRE